MFIHRASAATDMAQALSAIALLVASPSESSLVASLPDLTMQYFTFHILRYQPWYLWGNYGTGWLDRVIHKFAVTPSLSSGPLYLWTTKEQMMFSLFPCAPKISMKDFSLQLGVPDKIYFCVSYCPLHCSIVLGYIIHNVSTCWTTVIASKISIPESRF